MKIGRLVDGTYTRILSFDLSIFLCSALVLLLCVCTFFLSFFLSSYTHIHTHIYLSAPVLRFVTKYIATIGIDYGVKPVSIDGSEVRERERDYTTEPEP